MCLKLTLLPIEVVLKVLWKVYGFVFPEGSILTVLVVLMFWWF